MRRTRWFALWVACSGLLMMSGCIDEDKVTGSQEVYTDNVTGNWRFYGVLTRNDCDAFSFIPMYQVFDLQLHLDQDSHGNVTGRKIGGYLWSEVQPMERATVHGTYEDNVVNLTADFVNTQPVTSPPFVFPAGVDTTLCVLALSGSVDFTLTSAGSANGQVVASVQRKDSGGPCESWVDVPCSMFITGMWNRIP